MKKYTRRDILGGIAVPAALGLTLGLGACAVTYDERSPYATYPDHYYDYYFYPHIGVYFHLFSGDYYIRQHGRWRRLHALPPGIWLDPHFRVPLHVRKHRPHKYYNEHYSKHAKPKAWKRRKKKSHRDLEKRNHRERRHNTDRHGEYHKKKRR